MLVYDSEMGLALIVMFILGIILGAVAKSLYDWGIRNGTEIVNGEEAPAPAPAEEGTEEVRHVRATATGPHNQRTGSMPGGA